MINTILLIEDSSNQTLTAVTADSSLTRLTPQPEPVADPNPNQAATFEEIDKLCTALHTNLATAQRLLQRVKHEDNTEKDYLVETLRDVCDGLHQMLPPTAQFEAIVHQTVHQFLLMNKTQKLLGEGFDQSDKG